MPSPPTTRTKRTTSVQNAFVEPSARWRLMANARMTKPVYVGKSHELRKPSAPRMTGYNHWTLDVGRWTLDRTLSASPTATITNGNAMTCGCRSAITKLKKGNSSIISVLGVASTREARHHHQLPSGYHVCASCGGGRSLIPKKP